MPWIAWWLSFQCNTGNSSQSLDRFREAQFSGLALIQPSFESIQASAGTETSLAWNLKKADMPLSDLSISVQHSNLPFKASISSSLTSFVTSADIVSGFLHGFDARFSGFLTQIVVMDKDALRSLQEIEEYKNSRYTISPRVVGSTAPHSSREEIEELWMQRFKGLKPVLIQLIDHTYKGMTMARELDSQLSEISKEVLRADRDVELKQDELLARYWTFFGGNNHQKDKLVKDRTHLSKMEEYRSIAKSHVGAMLMYFRGMSAELDVLLTQLDTPEMADKRASSLEYRIIALQESVQKLADGSRAKPKEEAVLRTTPYLGVEQ
ncbi:hypothetical protein M408DRAFT_30361 [Serendipita vermifera MAFF 305830]|uniref:Uncharacterized protein n=1 Tax=Serendipita vermifera MAFF 305830 TaxID=933852 RepID=A0A0C3AK64_SERVB|nr:hypothetical protein M408DRAFT_30361 [Serendipita vermifera MAFF 305830]